ncbi:hypothetical protein CDV55_102546 [Aspergillus turcosus]|uniref:ATPase AAA-type core domain-containing protein n=1 Tax=Aspergillus turcosus TaxID=1245748 RepID=A0A229WYB6_9EURO|nr:hypothetical protein CDV55_102546 [Aspergillus turcosus]RLL95634.1 hypothetical protein CFD26_104354 [Aspergillus turcosus]
MISLGSPGLDESNHFIVFQKLPERCIVLLEDIDEAGISKRGGDISSQPSQDAIDGDEDAKTYNTGSAPGRISLSACLNVIDGVAAQGGRVLIMTTNNIDRLDSALLRAGRVDMKAFIGPVDRFMAEDLFFRVLFDPHE